jgi:hypothetical protein
MRRTPIILSNQRVEVLSRSLRIGDVIDGKIVARLGKERYVIEFQGHNFIASYQGFLKKGSTVQTITQQITPQVVFKILSGYALPFEMHVHEENLKAMIRESGGIVTLKPHCAELLSDIKQALQKFGKAKGDKESAQVFIRPIVPFVRGLFLTAEDTHPDVVAAYFAKRHEISSSVLLRSFKGIDALVTEASEGRYDHAAEALGEVGEGLKKLYLNLRLERALNTGSVLQEKGVTFAQVPLLQGDEHIPLDCYYREEGKERIYARLIIARDGEAMVSDVMYDKAGKQLTFSHNPAAWLPAAFLKVLEKNGIVLSSNGSDMMPSFVLEGEALTIDIIKPVRFDFVV